MVNVRPPLPFGSSQSLIVIVMENKYNTDIDRKLAVYYHPLFQQILTFISHLFNKSDYFQLGLLQFLQFNLKLQKSLLPTFEIENAVVSGLNDWVKQVAECLSFEGMVSTAQCVEVTLHNIGQLITNQIRKCRIQLLYPENQYKVFLKEFQKHDAFRLLGVTINHEVFCKFLFDLCSTWCQFLDIELFSSFLLTLILQMTQGQSLEQSRFKHTTKVTCINIQFLENFQNDKEEYSLYKKRQLRYYRAWCQWNYLRMVEIGEKIIVDLNELFPEDPRIPKITALFQTSIDTINEEVTLQAKGNKDELLQQKLQPFDKPKEFLIFKKLETKTNTLRQQITFVKSQGMNEPPKAPLPSNEYEIEIDEKGYMYLKPIIKMPVLGSKIQLRRQKKNEKKLYLLKKQQDQCRLSSNLYCHTGFYVSLRHEAAKPKEQQQPAQEMKQRFYKPPRDGRTKTHSMRLQQSSKRQMNKSLSKRSNAKQQVPQYQSAKIIQQEPQQQYIHQVMAPTFITGKDYNIGYVPNNYEIYGSQVQGAKRQLEYNFPKILHNDFKNVVEGKHIIGKFLTDRRKIRDKISQHSSFSTKKKPIDTTSNIIDKSYQQDLKFNKIKESSRHVWSRYISEEQMSYLTDYNQFYQKLLEFKREFSDEFRSDYMNMLKLEIAYHDSRYQMGGIYTREDKQRFSQRMAKLIARDDRRKRRLRRKRRRLVKRKDSADVTTKFKNGTAKDLFNYVFIDFHREKIKEIRNSIC